MQQLWRALAVALQLWRALRPCCRAAGAGLSSPPGLQALLQLLWQLLEQGQWETQLSQLSCGSKQPPLWLPSRPLQELEQEQEQEEGALALGAPAPPSPAQRQMQ